MDNTIKTEEKAIMTPDKSVRFDKSYLGCVIDGSCSTANYINQRTVEFAIEHGFDANLEENAEDSDQTLSEMGDEAIDYLNSCELLSHCSWQFEDNSLFYTPSVESAREDVGFVSVRSLADARRMGVETDQDDSNYPQADYEGEWLHVNDHGNATLYVRTNGEDTEIWSVV